MNTKPSKNRPKIGRPQIDERFRENLAALRDTTSISNGAARLARELLTLIAGRRLSGDDAVDGATVAALLVARASGMPRDVFCGWLRDTADAIEQDNAPAFSGTQP